MINSLRLQNFRSYTDASFEFEPGVTIIVGPNGSGKTNLLEGILVAAEGHSYRVGDEELISFEKPWSRLDARVGGSAERTIKLDRSTGRLIKSYDLNGRVYAILPHQQVLPAVLFEPNHLLLLTGAPDLRRTYLDDILSRMRPGFTSMRQHYRRALSQRNALLKQGFSRAQNQVFAWNLRLSELGGHIADARMDLVRTMSERLPGLYKELSHSGAEVTVSYKSNLPADRYASALLHKLENSLQTDCERGFTSSGPHRDDIHVLFDGTPANLTASRGETRTVLLGFKIMELKLLEEHADQSPILLLDDVFSELDGVRRQALTAYLRNYQAFITTTDADVVMHYFTENSTIIPLGER